MGSPLAALGPTLLLALLAGLPAAALGGEPIDPEREEGRSGLVLRIPGIEEVRALQEGAGGLVEGAARIEQGAVGNVVGSSAAARTSIDTSFRDARGILSVNQDAGSVNSQANVRVLASGASSAQVLRQTLEASVVRRGNVVHSKGAPREERIVGSFGGTRGVVGVNQSSGILNQQLNLFVLGAGSASGGPVATLTEVALERVRPPEAAAEGEREREASGARSTAVVGSFGGFRGVAQVAQSPGDRNVARNVVGISINRLEPGP